MHILARICATKHYPTESLTMNIGTIPKNMPTNFQPKQLKLKLDIVEKPENRVHKLTDSNVSPAAVTSRFTKLFYCERSQRSGAFEQSNATRVQISHIFQSRNTLVIVFNEKKASIKIRAHILQLIYKFN